MGRVTPEMFSSETPPERIMGVECEYHIQYPGMPTLRPDRFIDKLAMLEAGFRSVAGYMNDGSRLYQDVGFIEYSTAESYGPYATADADLTGIDKVNAVVAASGEPHDGMYRISGTTLSSDVTKKDHYTNGVHENFIFPGSLVHNRVLRGILTSHLASRIWAMNGNVFDGAYEFSQKINGIGFKAPIATDTLYGRRTEAGNKTMALLLRGDMDTISIEKNDDWARGEVRFADPQLSRYGRQLSLAATSLVFRLAEQQHLFAGKNDGGFDDIILRDPMQAAHGYMTDLSLKRKFEVRSGAERTAMDIQRLLVEKVHRLLELVDLPSDEINAAERWATTNDAIMRSKPEQAEYDQHLLDRIDVFAKHAMLVQSGSLRNDRVAKGRSLMWDRVAPTGIGRKYWARKMETPALRDDVQWPAIPLTERTKARIKFIEQYHNDWGVGIGWCYGNPPDDDDPFVTFPEPWG